MKIYVYTSQKAHGILVVVENLVKAFQRKGVNCYHITSLVGRNRDDIIIPYGVKEANEVLQKGFRPFASFMADAITLGYRNKINFYFKVEHFLHYDFFYSIYGYLRYTRQEKRVVYNYENVIFVSQKDIDFLKKKYPSSSSRYICVPNGLPRIKEVKKRVPSDIFRIGLLSAWVGHSTYEESNWFIRKYWPLYKNNHKDIVLRIAGKGARLNNFKGLPGVEVLGEVPDLADFFANCDCSLLLCPKGCGILNRVLDSFSYKIPVVGYEASFSGFPKSENVRYSFTDYESFENTIDMIRNNSQNAQQRSEKALAYARENYDWDKNYEKLVTQLLEQLDKGGG